MVATTPLSVAEFEAEAREGLWELINGKLFAVAPAGGVSSLTTARINGHVSSYLTKHPIGHAYSPDTGFILFPGRDTVRSPDFAFVSHARLPEIPETFIPLAPDLAVEVLSPSDRWADTLAKVAMYLQAGVLLVWVIDPANRTATIFQQEELPANIGEDGVLDGADILPGFTLPLAILFA